MAVLDTPEMRRKVVEMMWDLAVRKTEGPDSQGAPVDPDACWATFNQQLADMGLELTVIPSDGSETFIAHDVLDGLEPTPGH